MLRRIKKLNLEFDPPVLVLGAINGPNDLVRQIMRQALAKPELIHQTLVTIDSGKGTELIETKGDYDDAMESRSEDQKGLAHQTS